MFLPLRRTVALPRAAALRTSIYRKPLLSNFETSVCCYHPEPARSRLSTVWVPTGGITAGQDEGAHNKLIRAGFMRQSHSGIFHLLPLGLRVQHKLERVIEHYMQELGASRVALSTITSRELWESSGRFQQLGSELFGFEDRKGTQYMLSPTHEEEITSLVAKTVKSYKELPLRLYQISNLLITFLITGQVARANVKTLARKFRDELRPRHGLLRSREFTMKDLYTFDVSPEAALETYSQVQAAYKGVFSALKLPVMVANASSGDMGGDLSHEYHLPTPVGEDTVITCGTCDYTANIEIAETLASATGHSIAADTAVSTAKVWRGISKDRLTLVNVWYPGELLGELGSEEMHDADVSIPAVKSVIPDLDASIDDAIPLWKRAVTFDALGRDGREGHPKLVNVVDFRLANKKDELLHQAARLWPLPHSSSVRPELDSVTIMEGSGGQGLNVLVARAGNKCPSCDDGILRIQKALEVGHTFHLGTRYSEPLGAMVSIPAGSTAGSDPSVVPVAEKTSAMQMGCHGIGVSRLIGAVVEHLADEKGLHWPRAIAPYEAVIIPAADLAQEAATAYDEMMTPAGGSVGIDVALDDRKVSFAWKLKDADLVGYPIVVVLGKVWKQTGNYEIHCRRLGIKETVPFAGLRQRVLQLLEQL